MTFSFFTLIFIDVLPIGPEKNKAKNVHDKITFLVKSITLARIEDLTTRIGILRTEQSSVPTNILFEEINYCGYIIKNLFDQI